MDILASIPTIIEERKGKIRIYISTLPPIVNDDFLVKLKEAFDVEEACKDKPFDKCFAMLYGGVVISVNSEIQRLEIKGCVKRLEKGYGKEFSVEEFIKNPYDCFSFDNETICISKEKNQDCKVIDNIGLRFIIKDILL
mgnify:CR=1 FL=1